MPIIKKKPKISDYPDDNVYHYENEREEALDKALSFIKNCPYKGKGIKIELEANLHRDSTPQICTVCSGTGEVLCNECLGELSECGECSQIGYMDCEPCGGSGRTIRAVRRMDEQMCQDFILSNVSDNAKNSLVFSKTYYDGSVDTEFTFTLPLEKARYSIEFIKAFKKLADALGTKLEVHGAGMHIAILNSSTCKYPGGNSLDARRTRNFKYSMNRLLPALFFLASSDHKSRRLNYRSPSITSNKYSAISYNKKCFEYRVFETCYDRPEAIIDNICIIANTLRYYHYRKITHPFFGKIGTFSFLDMGLGIERFYKNETNFRALMAGIEVLKPSYKTIAQLRKERNFRLSLEKIKHKEKIKENLWKGEYKIKKSAAENDYEEAKKNYAKLYSAYKQNPSTIGYSEEEFKALYPNKEKFIKEYLENDDSFTVLNDTEQSYIEKKKAVLEEQISAVITI